VTVVLTGFAVDRLLLREKRQKKKEKDSKE
jgi:hypothetical protein